MTREKVCNPTKAAIYIAECLLATVEDFCMKSKPPVGEFKRHVSIAQTAIEFLESFHSHEEATGRVQIAFDDYDGCVEDYAKFVRNKWNPLDSERYFD